MSKKINIQFNNIKGSDIYSDFFYNGNLQNEEGIESVYNNAHAEATSNKVKVFKYKAPKRGRTDGFIKAKTIEKDGREYVNFYGLQEVKLNIKRNTKAYKYQIAQAFLYAVQYITEEIKFIIIPSVNYVDYLFMDENEINKDELVNLLEQYPPSEACKLVNIPELKIYKMDMPKQADITNMWKEIYKHCLQ